MVWTVVVCAVLGALVGWAVSSGSFMAGWRKDSLDEAFVLVDDANGDGSDAVSHTGVIDEPTYQTPWHIGGVRMLMGLGAGVGLVVGVLCALVTSVWWVALIAGSILTPPLVLLIAPLFIGEVRADLAVESAKEPTQVDSDGDPPPAG